jgi:hypothetical protein
MRIERCRGIAKRMANMSSFRNSTAKDWSRISGEPIDLLLTWSIWDVFHATSKDLRLFRVSVDLGYETSSRECSRERFDRLVVRRGLE